MAGGGDSQAGWRPAAVGVPAQGHTSPPRGREETPVPGKDQTEHAEAGHPHLKGGKNATASAEDTSPVSPRLSLRTLC